MNAPAAVSAPPRYGQVRYRWVVLGAAMAVNAAIQALWISYAPVTVIAEEYYGVNETAIGAFSMAFMIAFIPLSLPAAWLIDTRGVRLAVGIGVMLAGVGGLLRGFVGSHYAAALAASVVIALVQPLLINSWTAIAAAWFDRGSRATAVSLLTLSNVLGTAVALVAAPSLVRAWGIGGTQTLLGAIMAVTAVIFVAVVRDHPRIRRIAAPTSSGR